MIRQLLLLVLLAATPVAAPDPPAISLTLNPLVGYRPLTVFAQLRIDPNYLNRSVCLRWIGVNENYDGRACWQVEGQYAARLHFYTINQLPTGDYKISATLYQVRDTVTTPAQTIHVIDSPF